MNDPLVEEIDYLRGELVQWNDLKVALRAKDSTAFFDALHGRDKEIARLKKQIKDYCSDNIEADGLLAHHMDYEKRIAQLIEMLEEAMRIFAIYLNVPESRALQERWDKLKNGP